MKVEISKPDEEKIKKYIDEGRYKNMDEFITQAIKSLLYAEDRKEEFMRILGKSQEE